MFMKSLPSTMVFGPPELLEIKKTDNGQDFIIKSDLSSLSNKGFGAEVEAEPVPLESASSESVVVPVEQNASNGGK